MLKEEIEKIKSDKKELRKFGITVGIVFAIIASFILYKNRDFYIYFYITSAVFFIPGLLFPVVWE